MKTETFFLIMIALLFSPFPSYANEGSYSHITAVLGHKTFDMEYWEPAQDQGAFAVEYDFAKFDWPASLMIGFSYSDELYMVGEDGETSEWGPDGTKINTTSAELYGGARRYFRRDKRFVPYLGAGVSVVSMNVTVDSGSGDQKQNDIKFGAYFEVGLSLRWGSVSFGLINRLTGSNSISYFGREGDFRFFHDGFIVRFDLANFGKP